MVLASVTSDPGRSSFMGRWGRKQERMGSRQVDTALFIVKEMIFLPMRNIAARLVLMGMREQGGQFYDPRGKKGWEENCRKSVPEQAGRDGFSAQLG